jgi:diguanylate cyclase
MGPASRNSEHLAIIRDFVHAKAYCVSADLSNNLREAKPVSESSDWKQKYRDSLLEMETEEKRWRQVEQLLRRLIGRLCAAGMGIDPQLDDELSALAAANRRNADASELEQLADSLTTVVVAVDEVSSVRHPVAPLPITRWQSTCTAVAALLEGLKGDDTVTLMAEGLIGELVFAKTDAALASIVARAADLIHDRGESIARERLQAAEVLSKVTKRLEEMSSYLTQSNNASRGHFDDTQSLNDTVMSQVRGLTDEVSDATELGLLQSLVNTRLECVANQLSDFRAREENRLLEYTGRAEHMRTRIADLEREAQDLNSKLDREKHGARLDPLTGAANRKSFDERFAKDIDRRSLSEAPVTMLLWDIDNFKVINDSYGHRAGDRVLQRVAGCFKAAVRATDFVARIGGEEFVVILTGLKLVEALHIANQVRTAVESLRFHFRGTPVRVTVSCGLTELRQKDAAAAAFDRADAALYRAKHGGKNLCVAA